MDIGIDEEAFAMLCEECKLQRIELKGEYFLHTLNRWAWRNLR
ncbi:di- and tricarboxylate transporter [Actinobacillus equuli]|nr:di- and tricarboxylate transporter [Actinobacillus equuli]